jgi:hypothetical protein
MTTLPATFTSIDRAGLKRLLVPAKVGLGGRSSPHRAELHDHHRVIGRAALPLDMRVVAALDSRENG